MLGIVASTLVMFTSMLLPASTTTSHIARCHILAGSGTGHGQANAKVAAKPLCKRWQPGGFGERFSTGQPSFNIVWVRTKPKAMLFLDVLSRYKKLLIEAKLHMQN
jgi:hypothetical protein